MQQEEDSRRPRVLLLLILTCGEVSPSCHHLMVLHHLMEVYSLQLQECMATQVCMGSMEHLLLLFLLLQ
jgi:hypothetical protein